MPRAGAAGRSGMSRRGGDTPPSMRMGTRSSAWRAAARRVGAGRRRASARSTSGGSVTRRREVPLAVMRPLSITMAASTTMPACPSPCQWPPEPAHNGRVTLFDRRRLPPSVFKLDVERMRQGWYSDKYFINIARTLAELARQGYRFGGHAPPTSPTSTSTSATWTWAPSRSRCSGSRAGGPPAWWWAWTRPWPCSRSARATSTTPGRFVNTFDRMEVWAVHDGSEAAFEGDVMNVTPVMRVRGRYRDFAILETPDPGRAHPRAAGSPPTSTRC